MEMRTYHEAKDMVNDIMNLAYCIEQLGLRESFMHSDIPSRVLRYLYEYNKDFYCKVLDILRTEVECERNNLYEKFEKL